MGCGCATITKLCLCRHKERVNQRCFWYQLRANGSCWALCLPRCRVEKERYRVDRICVRCRGYFYEKFGQDYKRIAMHFLAYKESKGWQKHAIDPCTVPDEVLLRSEQNGTTRPEGSQPFSPHRPMRVPDYQAQVGSRRRLPTPSPTAPRARNLDDSRHKSLPPLPQHESTDAKDFDNLKGGNIAQPYRYDPGKDKPLPHLTADQSYFTVGVDDDEDEDEDEEGRSVFTSSPSPILSGFPRVPTPQPGAPSMSVFLQQLDTTAKSMSKSEGKKPMVYESPQPNYTRQQLSPGESVPELSHLTESGAAEGDKGKSPAPADTPELKHPLPVVTKLRHKLKNTASDESMASEASLVKKLRKRAESIEHKRMFVSFDDGTSVPIIDKAPKTRRRRRMSPLQPYVPNPGDDNSTHKNANEPENEKEGAEANKGEGESKGLDEDEDEDENDMRTIDIALEANAVPTSLIPGAGKTVGVINRDRNSTAVDGDDDEDENDNDNHTAAAKAEAPSSGKSSPTRTTTIIIPPPRRLDGILIPSASACPKHSTSTSPSTSVSNSSPAQQKGEGKKSVDCVECRGTFFRERGIASPYHARAPRSALLLPHRYPPSGSGKTPKSAGMPVYVSVRTPRRSYSCAVQSCYCGREAGKEVGAMDKCPSCQERDTTAAEWQTNWI